MKKLLSLLLVLVIAFTLVFSTGMLEVGAASNIAGGTCGDDVEWWLTTEGVLHIEGKAHEEESEKEGKKYILRERRSASFSRTFSLPDGIEENNLEAKFENGILSIRLPKKPEEKPQRIEVKLG